MFVALAFVREAVAEVSVSGSVCGAPARGRVGLEPEFGGVGHHRWAPGVHGGDDLFGVDALQVDAGRAEVGLTQLALN